MVAILPSPIYYKRSDDGFKKKHNVESLASSLNIVFYHSKSEYIYYISYILEKIIFIAMNTYSCNMFMPITLTGTALVRAK